MHSTFKHFARALPVVAMVAVIACSGGTPVAPGSASSAVPGSSAAGPDGETLKAHKPTLRALARESGWHVAVPAQDASGLPDGVAQPGRTAFRAELGDLMAQELLRPRSGHTSATAELV